MIHADLVKVRRHWNNQCVADPENIYFGGSQTCSQSVNFALRQLVLHFYEEHNGSLSHPAVWMVLENVNQYLAHVNPLCACPKMPFIILSIPFLSHMNESQAGYLQKLDV